VTAVVGAPGLLAEWVGRDLGPGEWYTIVQPDVDLFGQVTGDEQWIHTDPERAAAGPFGATIAHGFMSLSLMIPLWSQLLVIENMGMGINYGVNRVRFPAPLPVGSRVRLTARLVRVEPVAGGVHATIDAALYAEGRDKPVCVAQMEHRYLD
jgi:acyl dehydratase